MNTIVAEYDETQCSSAHHGVGHLEEVGHNTLPQRTTQALSRTYAALATFAANHPEYRVKSAQSPSQSVTDLLTVLRVEDGSARLQAMNKLIVSRSFKQMPGNYVSQGAEQCVW